MAYITVAETAKKWGVSVRRIQSLCRDGRIANVIRLGRSWGIPEEAAKPVDKRLKAEPIERNITNKDKESLKKQPLPDFVAQNPFFSVYPCDKMTIFVTKKPAALFKGEFSHLSYEFIIIKSFVKGMVIDGHKIDAGSDMMVAINSDQMHGTRFLISEVSFLTIQFEKEFLEELLFGVYGVKHARFDNTPIPSSGEIEKLVAAYIDEYEHKREGYAYFLSNLSVQIAVAIFRETGVAKWINVPPADQNAYIKKAIAHLKENFEESFSLDALAGLASMSKFSFIRKFKELTGTTPYDYFMDIRIMNALELLSNTQYRVIDVAIQCGFKSHSHFSKQFRIRTGMTPVEYRKNILRQ